jgi:hypothetical protein
VSNKGLRRAIMGALAALAVPGGAATAADARSGTLTIENPLQACVQVQAGTRAVDRGVVLQDITLDIRKPIGECGCKSAVLGYASHVVMEGGGRSLLQQGRFGARQSGPRAIALASDPQLIGGRPVVLSLDCMAPD